MDDVPEGLGLRLRFRLQKGRWAADKVPDEIRPRKRRRLEEMLQEKFPQEILDDVLLRLPIKSLLTCTGVCKPWRSLILSSAFICNHLRLRQSDKQKLLLVRSSEDKYGIRDEYSLHFDNSPSFGEYSKLTHPFLAYRHIKTRQEQDKKQDIASTSTQPQPQPQPQTPDSDCRVRLIGTCNGLVCLEDGNFTSLIWNPYVRKFVILPPPALVRRRKTQHPWVASYAFGYDSCNNDHKVFRCLACDIVRTASCKFEIYSLARGSWKRLSAPVLPEKFFPRPYTCGGQNTFVRGALHWIQKNGVQHFIVSFDLSTEVFGEITMPEPDSTWKKRKVTFQPGTLLDGFCRICRYGESLAFFEKSPDTYSASECGMLLSMWVMKEYGVAESWVKLYALSMDSYIQWRPLLFRNSGEVVHLWAVENRRYRVVDPKKKTQEFNEFQIDGRRHYLYRNIDYFVESLILLDHPNAISY